MSLGMLKRLTAQHPRIVLVVGLLLLLVLGVDPVGATDMTTQGTYIGP